MTAMTGVFAVFGRPFGRRTSTCSSSPSGVLTYSSVQSAPAGTPAWAEAGRAAIRASAVRVRRRAMPPGTVGVAAPCDPRSVVDRVGGPGHAAAAADDQRGAAGAEALRHGEGQRRSDDSRGGK